MASANGKCFIVVGAGNGLGYAISKRLLGSGARVVISSRTRENLEKLKERLSKFGRVDYVAGDATKSEDAKRVASEAKRIMGRIDGAVIQVGDFLGDNFESFNADNAYKMVSANLVAPLIAVQAMSGAMERGAAVVFISNSEAAQTKKTSTNLSYLVSKAALNKAVEMVAAELLPHGIRANGIAPNSIADPEKKERSEMGSQEQRPEDLAELAEWLLGDESVLVDGVVIPADSGYRFARRR